jgi:hypothetical protein
MRPLEEVHTVAPSTPVIEELETMGRDDVTSFQWWRTIISKA